MRTIEFKKLDKDELTVDLFSSFNRYQEVNKCWRKENGEWVLKDIQFNEQWGIDDFNYLVKCLQNTVMTGGVVFGAFHNNVLVGFASIENQLFGSENEYIQLSSIHISFESRGMRIGKKLFSIMCEKAREEGAKKLYISAHSSEETQAFYKALGCVEAKEYNAKLVAEEPCDCQLEYSLFDN